MPEANGLKQVLYGDPGDDVAPVNDDVADVSDDTAPVNDDVADVSDDTAPVNDDVAVTTLVDQEQELEEPSSIQVDHNEKSERIQLRDTATVENGPSEKTITDDDVKEDKFVEFSDELNVSDSSRVVIIEDTKQISVENDDTHEAQVHELVSNNTDLVTIEETKQNLKDKDDSKEAKVFELDNGTQEEVVVHSPKESKDENGSLLKEFANLHHQLKALSSQKSYNSENEETEEIEKILSIHDTANECSKLVKNAVEEKLHIEEEFKKLQLSLLAKDQEIDHLHVKISELSVSESSILSFLNSQHKNSFDSSNSSIEVQNGLQSIDDSINRMLASLSSMVNADGFSDESITGKMSFLEQNLSQLFGNYQDLFSENELFKRKEVDSSQHINNLEEENKRVNAEIEKIREELEEEKIRYANTKEKLSMAVTKGKALVQQKDSLKQSLAEKTIEIEKYLAEISQRDSILSKCEEILFQNSVNHELESADIMERIRSLVDEKNTMAGVMMEYNKLEYVLSSFDFPEDVLSSDIESRVSWLVESLTISKGEMGELQDEAARSSEVLLDKIESLTVSLLDETQEKNFIREELERLKHKYQEIVERDSQLLVEKDRTVSLLAEALGTAIDEIEVAGMDLLIDRCISKIKSSNSLSHDSSAPGADDFENLQTNLYLKDQELMLCKELLEKDTQMRLKVSTLENELGTVSQELLVLKDEKSAIERDFKHSDEKTSSLREKLSMAVKKGKGLAQDRENLKKLMDEKDIEIEKLKLELQQQESALNDFRNQIDKFSANLELIPKLEVDLNDMKDKKDQVEQFLLESNNMIEKVMESIDGIVIPVDVTFEEPIEKVLWLVRYLNECQDEKTLMEKEFDNLKVDFDSLSSKLTEAYTAKSSLEEAITTAENSISQLREENSNLSEVCETRKLLEDELSEAQNKISILIIEKDEAQLNKAIETELEKVKEEVSTQTSTLADAYKTINSLKDALSHLETNVSFLSMENNDSQVHKNNLEHEMNKLKEEAESQSSKYLDATSTIRLLENNLSKLVDEKKLAEEEILSLNSKLDVCMEELSGLGVSSENRSMELFSHLNNLQLLLKDETLSSILKESFEVKFQSLRNMDLLLRDINENLIKMGSDSLPSSTSTEEDYFVNISSAGLDNFANGEIDKGSEKSEGGDSFEYHFRNSVKGMSFRNKILSEKVQHFSFLMDDCIASLLKNLHLTKDEIVHKLDQVRSLEEKVNDLETGRDAQKLVITTLENNIKVLLSACTVTAQELENEVENYEVELSSVRELKKWTDLLFEVREVKPAENLLMAAQKVCALTRQLERERNDSVDVIKGLEIKMAEIKATAKNALEERDLLQARISKLEDDLEVLQSSHEEMSTKVEEYQAKETTSSDREAEISSLRRSLVTKEKDAEDALLVASQIEYVYEKINDLENLFPEVNMGEFETNDSGHLNKLSYIIDAVSSMQQQMNILCQDKEKLEANVVKQAHQIENLGEKIEDRGREKELLEKMKTEISEAELGIKNIVYKLGGNNLVGDQKSEGVMGLFVVLEKLVTEILLEYDNTKSRGQELGVKLHESQKVVDELAGKVKSFEITSQVRSPPTDGLEDRSVFEVPHLPTRSEIIELEDVGPVGKKAKGSSPSAPHARPLRKGSTDHLAINIDSESDRLIKDDENDEDKGKVFKSLNTSGLIPVQGKMLADRIDGFWVSGERALMSRPRVRLGLIAYWLLLHIWLLGTIL